MRLAATSVGGNAARLACSSRSSCAALALIHQLG